MATKPILFNTEMVKAILEGRKTQTRRLCKGQPQDGVTSPEAIGYTAPYNPGDVLWVRETWVKDAGRYMYRANYSDTEKFYMNGREIKMVWRPSIHMPREAARLFLRVKAVRVDRLQEITSGEAVAEGIQSKLRSPSEAADALIAFEELWNSTIKPADLSHYGWDANPWVWVIEFERVEAML